MDKKLLSIICCPITRKSLKPARADLLKSVNAAIDAGTLVNHDGVKLGESLSEALVTEDGKILYPVNDGIPVLLEGESVRLDQLQGNT
ncbi:MAG: Trm112 family protein [Woeseiaceae bacterium]|nr:Trm112 family protein [Woeseiaceae bacterium]